jgi:pimeloyl-ACP methyl ester carboxylesterase
MLNPLALSREHHYLENALRLATLAEIAYRDDPFTPLAPFIPHRNRVRLFAHAGTFGYVVSDKSNLVIALRGTDQVIDWVTNLRTNQVETPCGHAHQGFVESLDSVWDQIVSHVEGLLDAGQTVWLTGHSLGGALATLAASRLLALGMEPYLTCTYGAPRVFHPRGAHRYLPRLYRFVNQGDLVPSMPPLLTLPWYRYQHTGNLQVTLMPGRRALTILGGRELDLFRLLKWLANPTIDWKQDISQRLADHALRTYIQLLRAELAPEQLARMEGKGPAVAPLTERIKPRRKRVA